MRNLMGILPAGAVGAVIALALVGATEFRANQVVASSTSGMVLSGESVTFPDGTVQTTANPRRSFYLTTATYRGETLALETPCADGFHFASVWEVADVSNLRYAVEILGASTQGDSGAGPPTGAQALGWIRTGAVASDAGGPGKVNCNAWNLPWPGPTSSGTIAFIPDTWSNPSQGQYALVWGAPWASDTRICSAHLSVWCVED